MDERKTPVRLELAGEAQHVVAGVCGHQPVEELELPREQELEHGPRVGAVDSVHVGIRVGGVLDARRAHPQGKQAGGLEDLLGYVRTDGADHPFARLFPGPDLLVVQAGSDPLEIP